jgi:predicted nucleotidyltransferase component of viral defense system
MKFLTDNTLSLFNQLSGYEYLNSFTFVGGSAVAYYLNHRLSEDLDFFTWTQKLPLETDNLIKKISGNREVLIANRSETYFDIFIDGIKVTFFANDWQALKENRIKISNYIYAADLPLLCAMKINTLSLRAKFRDYYDLYVMNKEKYSIEDIFNLAVKFLPGITKKVFAMQLTYINDIEDENIVHLSPKYNVSLAEIQKHFKEQIKTIL